MNKKNNVTKWILLNNHQLTEKERNEHPLFINLKLVIHKSWYFIPCYESSPEVCVKLKG